MKYIAVVDYEHLDNGVFLNAMADALAKQSVERAIIIHGDSEHTDRIMQLGIMREEAKVRSIKELNHRLIALLADSGVPTIGINGYQRDFISYNSETGAFTIDHEYYNSLPPQPVLLISNLLRDATTGDTVALDLPDFAEHLQNELNVDPLVVFNRDDSDEVLTESDIGGEAFNWDNLSDKFKAKHLPEEFHSFNKTIKLTSARTFGELPKTDNLTTITP